MHNLSMDSGDDYRPDLQEQIDALRGRVDDNHWEIDKLARAGKLDRDDIDALVKAGSLDHDDIAKLMASGMLDRDDIDRLLVQMRRSYEPQKLGAS